MASAVRPSRNPRKRQASARRVGGKASIRPALAAKLTIAVVTALAAILVWWRYTFAFQWPVQITLQAPVLVTLRDASEYARQARADQDGRPLTAHQQYACEKFGSDCRIALAIQRAENPQGKCEIYHYNTNGTLDWGYFQINTVHLDRKDLNLRDLLDCRANIDFAYQLYLEKRGFTPWSTYNSGIYRRFLKD